MRRWHSTPGWRTNVRDRAVLAFNTRLAYNCQRFARKVRFPCKTTRQRNNNFCHAEMSACAFGKLASQRLFLHAPAVWDAPRKPPEAQPRGFSMDLLARRSVRSLQPQSRVQTQAFRCSEFVMLISTSGEKTFVRPHPNFHSHPPPPSHIPRHTTGFRKTSP